jgi:hypothetical protein
VTATATAIRSSMLALVASLLVPACAAPGVDEEVAAVDAELTSAAFQAQAQIVGSLQYGETSAVISYRNPTRFRAFKFAGDAGDEVVIDVRSSNGGDAMAWVLDDDFRVIASNDDAADGVYDSHIALTLPEHRSRTHYILFRDYGYRARQFSVELQGVSGIVACKVDADCQKVVAGCCRLSWTAVHSGREEDYRKALECPADLICPMMMVRDTDDVAQCDNDTHQCELRDPLAIACGGHSRNMHECPDGYVCAGAGLAVDVPGVCRKPCNGFSGAACEDNFRCVDDPTDDCTAENGGADCGGICQPKTCGGFGNLSCPDSLECIDDPNDGCDIAQGGADCGSLCAKH